MSSLIASIGFMLSYVACSESGETAFGFFTSTDTSPEVVEPTTSEDCPIAGMVYIEGFDTAVLGNPHCNVAPNTFRAWEFYNLEPFCLFTFPFPGEGVVLNAQNESPEEYKLSYGDVLRMVDDLHRIGVRLPTVVESLWAASGPSNLKYTYCTEDDPQCEHIQGLCSVEGDADQGAINGYADPIGSDPSCESWAGVRDLGSRGIWWWLDDQSRAALKALENFESVPWADDCWWGHEWGIDEDLQLLVGGTYMSNGNTSGDNFGHHHHLFDPGAFYDGEQWPDGNEWPDDALRFATEPAPFDQDLSDAWWGMSASFTEQQDYNVIHELVELLD